VRERGEVRKEWEEGLYEMGVSGSWTIFQSESGFSRKHNASNRQHLDFTLPSIFIAILFFSFALFLPDYFTFSISPDFSYFLAP
jgi:hypothetical protein